MIKDLGNCGNPAKLERVMSALKSAQQNECRASIAMDPLVYGSSARTVLTAKEISKMTFAVDNMDLLIIKDNSVIHRIPWWDITVIVVAW